MHHTLVVVGKAESPPSLQFSKRPPYILRDFVPQNFDIPVKCSVLAVFPPGLLVPVRAVVLVVQTKRVENLVLDTSHPTNAHPLLT